MKIVEGRLNEKSKGYAGEMMSYHYWKIDGKKLENLSIPDSLDAHVEVGKPVRATYVPGKDNVNIVLATQSINEPVRSVVTTTFLIAQMGRFSILPLMVAVFTIFIAYGLWQNSISINRTSFSGSIYQLSWFVLNAFVTYRFMIKPALIVRRGVKEFRAYCANAPLISSNVL
ncbi:hypothetical protein EKG40_03740 [Pseudomonas moorei]|nr:hypothetical protein EKG40_03740 [Pseudomonas moorei]